MANNSTAVFIDTSFFIALANIKDIHHSRAKTLQAEFRHEKTKKVTTEYVLFEVADGLSRLHFRKLAIDILLAVLQDESFEIVSSQKLFLPAFDLYRNRADKEWELTDCSSFVVMREMGIEAAATADRHYQQAGFNALLLEK